MSLSTLRTAVAYANIGPDEPKRGRAAKISYGMIDCVLLFLSDKLNYKLMTGTAGQGQAMVAGKPLKKTDGLRMLADFVNDRLNIAGTAQAWTKKSAKSRYESLLKKYKQTKRDFMDVSGKKFALTAEEIVWKY